MFRLDYIELCQHIHLCHLDIEDSSWLRMEDEKIFSRHMTENRAMKERAFQERTRQRFYAFHEEDIEKTIGRCMKGLLFTNISDFESAGQYYWKDLLPTH